VTTNGSAHIWEVATGKELRTLHTKQQNPVYTAEFSPDGKLVVTAGGDRKARIWDAQTGIELRVLDGHMGAVYSATAPTAPRSSRPATTGRPSCTRARPAGRSTAFWPWPTSATGTGRALAL